MEDLFKKLGNITKPDKMGGLPFGREIELRWVAVLETKPEVGQWLLVYAPTGRHIAWYDGYSFQDRGVRNVTHWMQIPEPPCI